MHYAPLLLPVMAAAAQTAGRDVGSYATSSKPLGTITQMVTNKSGSPVNKTGIILIASLGALGSAASIPAVSASASISCRSLRQAPSYAGSARHVREC